jgi:hypothetical protein
MAVSEVPFGTNPSPLKTPGDGRRACFFFHASEVSKTLPLRDRLLDLVGTHQTQLGVVDQGSRLERLAVLFLGQLLRG